MVRFWDIQLDKAIKLTKFRIKYMEKHGLGKNAMDEKSRLHKQERHRELEKQKGRFK